MKYSTGFKNSMIQKMTSPQGQSAGQLANQVGVPQTTLSRWLREAATLDTNTMENLTDNQRTKILKMVKKRPHNWPPEQKLKVVLEAEHIADENLGQFLRSKGIHQAQLEQWRQLMLFALKENAPKKSSRKPADTKRIRELEKELNRKEKALAETAALLVLKKKALALWGDEDNSTQRNNGK